MIGYLALTAYIASLGWIAFGPAILAAIDRKPDPETTRQAAKARLRAAEARRDSRSIHHARKAMEAATTSALRRRAF